MRFFFRERVERRAVGSTGRACCPQSHPYASVGGLRVQAEGLWAAPSARAAPQSPPHASVGGF